MHNSPWTDEEVTFLKDNYCKIPYCDIAERLNRNVGAVSAKAAKLGITKGNRATNRQNRVNDEFFSEKNKLSCFYAGFIAADGNIHSLAKGTRAIQIGLHIKDYDFLKAFRQNLGFTGKIYKYTRIEKASSLPGMKEDRISHTCKIMVNSKQLVKDLEDNFNIVPAKTYILMPPNLKEDYQILSFLAGYLDGDGATHLAKHTCPNGRVKKSPQIYLSGMSKEFMKWADKETARILESPKESYLHQRKNGMWEIRWVAGRAIKLANLLFELGLPQMPRKWDWLRELPKNVEKGYTIFGERHKMNVITSEQEKQIKEMLISKEFTDVVISKEVGVTEGQVRWAKKKLGQVIQSKTERITKDDKEVVKVLLNKGFGATEIMRKLDGKLTINQINKVKYNEF